MRVLLVEDDPAILEQVRSHLSPEEFDVCSVGDGESALRDLVTARPGMVILDIALEDKTSHGEELDGLRILKRIRESSDVPVIMLTQTSAASVKVYALSMGADDYVTKPFDGPELVARVKAVLRRGKFQGRSALEYRRLTVDPAAHRVWKDGTEICNLTPLEFELLLRLARRPGLVLTRRQLLQSVWDFDHFGDERLVDTHICHVRKKLEDDPAHPELIITVRGVGYRFEDHRPR